MKRKTFLFFILYVFQIITCGCAEHTLSTSTWIGNYTFEEVSPAAIKENMYVMCIYTIDIYEENDELIANININGFQIAESIPVKVIGDSKRVEFVFSSDIPNNISNSYNDGDILLTFEKGKSDIITIWGKIKPMVIDNIESGVYFKKVI